MLFTFNYPSTAVHSCFRYRFKTENTFWSACTGEPELSQIMKNIAAKSLAKSELTIDIQTITQILPSLETGDFAVFYGDASISYLASMLCVKAQLPTQMGGLNSKVIFIDGGNRFRLYDTSKLAQLYRLNPTQVLKKISIARAFTAYQMTSLIMDKLNQAVEATDAKIAVISDIAGLFLDGEIADEESQAIYSQVVTYLTQLAKEKQIIIAATYPSHSASKRNASLQISTNTNAAIVASIRVNEHNRYFMLQKHPRYVLGSAEFPQAYTTLPEFFGGCS